MKLDGAEQLNAALSQLSAKVEGSIMRQALRSGAKVIQSAAKGTVPVSTGNLQANIKVRAGKRTKGVIKIVVGLGAKSMYRGEAYYGAFVEYGHKIGSRKLGGNRKSVAPNPFLARAQQAAEGEAIAAVQEQLKAGIEEASK